MTGDVLELIGAVLLAVVCGALLCLFYVWARQRLISANKPMMLCALHEPGSPWRLGFARMGPTTLDWYAAVGVRLKPNRHWSRAGLVVGLPTDVSEPAGSPDQVIITLEGAGEPADLALARGDYFAMRSWVESPPPGYNVNFA
ncbi:DUF2550 family protein [Kribbia dieselivorans]|uniref:DUF2550 family protein n=1 Tax=Kribbia dieselivorans TaxID=331526 RepID=UPI000839404C|nr:DUF2550 family protein [Kribbia dieselivorans]